MNDFIVTLTLSDSLNKTLKEYHINFKFVSLVKVEFGKTLIYVGGQVIEIDEIGSSNMSKRFIAAWEKWKANLG